MVIDMWRPLLAIAVMMGAKAEVRQCSLNSVKDCIGRAGSSGGCWAKQNHDFDAGDYGLGPSESTFVRFSFCCVCDLLYITLCHGVVLLHMSTCDKMLHGHVLS